MDMDAKNSFPRWKVLLIGLVLIVGVQYLYLNRSHPLEGKLAPHFEAPALDGERVAVQAKPGQPILLDFWAIWCPPCRASLPEIAAIWDEYRERGVAVYAVNLGDDPEHIRAFLGDLGVSLPVLLDPSGALGALYGASAIPQTVIVNQQGIVVQVHRGAGPGLGRELRAALDGLLEEGGEAQVP